MKYLSLFFFLLVQHSSIAQILKGVDYLDCFSDGDRKCCHIQSGKDAVTLEVPRYLQDGDEVFMDDQYCLVLLINEETYNAVSAAFKSRDKWIQDYMYRAMFFPFSAFGIEFTNIEIIDGETLDIEYLYKAGMLDEEKIKTKWSLGLNGFFDHHLLFSLNTRFSKKFPERDYVRPNYFSQIGELLKKRYPDNQKK